MSNEGDSAKALIPAAWHEAAKAIRVSPRVFDGTGYSSPIRVDSDGHLQVDILSGGGGGGGTEYTEATDGVTGGEGTLVLGADETSGIGERLRLKAGDLRVTLDGESVSVDLAGTTVPLPSGAATEATLAAIKTAVEILDNAISGTEMQVDVLTLPALPAGSNNIGDVDVVSTPEDTPAYDTADIAANTLNGSGGAWVTALTLSNVTTIYSLEVWNTSDVDITLSFDGTNIEGHVVSAGQLVRDYKALTLGETGNISARARDTTAPSQGRLLVSVVGV